MFTFPFSVVAQRSFEAGIRTAKRRGVQMNAVGPRRKMRDFDMYENVVWCLREMRQFQTLNHKR